MSVPVVLAIAGVGLLVLGLGIVEEGNFLGKFKFRRLPVWTRVLSSVAGMALVGTAIWLILPVSDTESTQLVAAATEQVAEPSSKYSFEEGTMGWIPQDFDDSRAVVDVHRTDERAKDGRYSLAMDVSLIGGHPNNSKGEVWVDMRDLPPTGDVAPLDLDSSTLTAWVYAPSGARGEGSRPNGFQLFVKDDNFRSLYGSWRNVVAENWVQVFLPVAAFEPRDGYMDPGFDPSRIIVVGVKIATGTDSRARYEGVVFIDQVEW